MNLTDRVRADLLSIWFTHSFVAQSETAVYVCETADTPLRAAGVSVTRAAGAECVCVCVCEEKKSDDFSMHANLKTQET